MSGSVGPSVVIPAHNAEPFLRATIESALAQTLPPSEVIVVDDASRDATADIASSFGTKVRVLRGEGRGVSAARNAGVAASRGPLIAFLDHDDLWERDKILLQVKAMSRDPRAVLSFTQAIVEAAGEAGASGEIFPIMEEPDRILGRAYAELLHWNFVPMSSVVVRAEALRALPGPFDTRYALSEDWDLWLRLARGHPGGFQFLAEPLTRYRIVAGRATERMADLRLEDLAIFEEQVKECPWLESDDPRRCRASRHRLRREAGYWLLREGRRIEARAHLREAWRLRPGSIKPLGYLAAAWLGRGGR